jgi:hydrogenase expression/formation protein HypC
MCIGIPMQVIEAATGRALCADGDSQVWIDTRLVDAVQPGVWLLVFAGAAREQISAERAALVSDALQALQASARGDHAAVERLFADLIGREPQLPPHLRAQSPTNDNQDS